nr:immunoglobulin domain-containing protein [Treponema sp.]
DKASYVEGDTVVCTADVSNVDDDAVLSCEWYVNKHKIPNETEITYEFEVSEAGDYDVYCNVIATRKNGIYIKTNHHVADDATITVSALVAATPTVSTSTSPVNYEKNATASAMEVTARVTDGGTLSYQWYKASNATEAGEDINTATSSSYTPDTSKAGITYYYAKVTNTKTNGSKSVTAVKDSGRIVVNVTSEETYAATPVISAQPQSKDYYQGDTATALSVTASVTSEGKAIGGNLSYQWYKATSADGVGSAISSATNETYTPEIAAIGSIWYYCIVTNTAEAADINKTATKKSSYAKISVTEFVAKKPSVSISPATVSVKSGDSVTLTASVSGQDEGAVLTYQWKKDGEAIQNATSSTYTFNAPSVTEETNFNYSCVVTSRVTKYNATATATGDKTVNVTVAPATGSISIDFN